MSLVVTWARKWPLAPRWRTPPAEHLALTAADGTRIAAVRLAGPAGALASVVLVHGVTNSNRTPAMRAFALELARWVHVVAPDLRGHGRSGGASTLGVLEPLDVAAAVDAASDAAPGRRVVAVGVSLGGLSSLLAAGRTGGVAGVYSLSAPAWIEPRQRRSSPIGRLVGTPPGRLAVRLLMGTRVARARQAPTGVASAVAAIAPAFVVIAHDPEDPYVGREHAEALFAAAREPKELWWLPDAGHGGRALTPELAARIHDDLERRLG